MIQFKCHHCAEPLEVGDDQAGESLQCPGCGRLLDVPRLDDLGHLTDDGTYELNDEKPRTAMLLPDSKQLPSSMTHDGRDRRGSLEEFMSIGITPEEQMEIQQEVRPGVPKAPKYDPITGELLSPIDVKPKQSPPSMGVAQPVLGVPTLNYATNVPDAIRRETSMLTPFFRMFDIGNVIVQIIVLLFTGINLSIVFAVPVGGILYLFLIFPVVALLIISHFANVIDETGPTGRDQLPTIFRNASFIDDFWNPTIQLARAFIYCGLPIIAVGFFFRGKVVPWYVLYPLFVLMILGLPAALLTSICSGSINNMSPERCFGVIPIIGWRYLVPVGMLILGLYVLQTGLFMLAVGTIALGNYLLSGSTGNSGYLLPPQIAGILAWPVMAAGLYCLHVAAWQIGLFYRRYHDRFPWVLQHFHRTDRTDVMQQLRQRRLKDVETKIRQRDERAQKLVSSDTGAPVIRAVR